jgi:hypothetical protein
LEGDQETVLVEFDQTTIDNMTAALGTVCKKIPPDKDSYDLRKRIADTMVEYVQSGGREPENFERIGTKTLQEITRPPSFNWFGLRRFFVGRA